MRIGLLSVEKINEKRYGSHIITQMHYLFLYGLLEAIKEVKQNTTELSII